MHEITKDLGRLLIGEVTSDKTTCKYFATDGSVFTVRPSLIIYPRNERDIILTVKYLEQQAREGRHIGITARGKGTDQAGGALGNGAVLVFPAHMKRLIRYGKKTITIQPGMIYAHLQGILHSHGRFLPPYPASLDFATIGGAIANNAAGEKTIKYGSTRDYVESLKVVVSNGDVIETGRLSKRELGHKKRQADFEGQIYRDIDTLIDNNRTVIDSKHPHVSKNAAGYDLWDVKSEDGSFDLSQLMVGSQGTLGVISEITMRHLSFNPTTILVVGFFESIDKAAAAVEKIMPLKPSALEVVDSHLLAFLKKHKPEQIEGLIPESKPPEIVLLVEFDEPHAASRNRKAKKTGKIFNKLSYQYIKADEQEEQDALWKIRRGAAAVIWMFNGPKKALPIIEDAVVPLHAMVDFLRSVYRLLKKHKLDIAVWGHAGNANFHLQPFLNIGNVTDRKKAFALMDEFYQLVIKMGGSTCGEHNDGILRAPYLEDLYGKDMYALFTEVKRIFDPLNILNPDVKIGVTKDFAWEHLRNEYSMKHLNDYLPNTYNK